MIHVAKERGVEVADVLKLIGLDRGQGHCQLTLQPHQESDLAPAEAKVSKRRRRQDGVSGQDKAGLGLNNLLILATSPVKSENWINLDMFLGTDWKIGGHLFIKGFLNPNYCFTCTLMTSRRHSTFSSPLLTISIWVM